MRMLATIHFDKPCYIVPHLFCVQKLFHESEEEFSYVMIDDGPNYDQTLNAIDNFPNRDFPIHYFAANRRPVGESPKYLAAAELFNFIYSDRCLPNHKNVLVADVEILFHTDVAKMIFEYCESSNSGGMHTHTANMKSQCMPQIEKMMYLPNNYEMLRKLIWSDPNIKYFDMSGKRVPNMIENGGMAHTIYADIPPIANPSNREYSSGLAFIGLKRDLFWKIGGMPTAHIGYDVYDHYYIQKLRLAGLTMTCPSTEFFNIQLPHPWSNITGSYQFAVDRPVLNPTYKLLSPKI